MSCKQVYACLSRYRKVPKKHAALREILAEHAYRESDKEYHNSDEGKEHWDGWEDDYGLEPLDFGDKD